MLGSTSRWRLHTGGPPSLSRLIAVSLLLLALAGCAPVAPPSPTAAPPKPTEAPRPAAKATEAPAARPAEKPAEAKPAAKATEAPAARPAEKPAAKPAPFDEKAVAEFYRGKTVRIIVGYAAGGGYDTYTRRLAPHLARHIPGNPTVIVENMAGAGGLVATNHVYSQAPKDGTVILHVGSSSMLKQLAGDKAVEYDAVKFHYLGGPFADRNVLVVRKAAGAARLEDVLGPNGKQIVLGGISKGSPQDVAAIALRDVLGGKVKLVTGYDGTAKIKLAVEQGELDGYFNAWESLQATGAELVASGEWLILTQLADPIIPEISTVPSMLDLAKDEEQRRLIRYTTLVPYQFARPYLLAPEVPLDRVRALQQAFDRTVADKEFLAEAEKGKLLVQPIGGEKMKSLVQEFFSMPAALKEKVVKILES